MDVNKLTRIIKKKTGMRIQDFVKEKLGVNHYNVYRYRVLNDCLKLDDYHKICFYTGQTFEQLFPTPLGGSARNPITLNLSRKPATTTITPLAKPQVDQASVMSHSLPTKKKDAEVTPKQEDTKKGQDITPARSFQFVDPFEGNLPD